MPFADALAVVLTEEVNPVTGDPYNPADPSMYGVTQRTYDRWRTGQGLNRRDVRQITVPEYTAIYETNYWQESGADELDAQGNTGLALFHFDTAVNLGVSAANDLLAQSGGDLATYAQLRKERYQAIEASQPAQHANDLPVWLGRVDRVLAVARSPLALGAITLLVILALVAWWYLSRNR